MNNKQVNIENGFNNILVIASDVAKMYGVNYTPEQIAQAKSAYTSMVEQKLTSMGFTPNNQANITPDVPMEPVQEEKPMQMTYQSEKMKKAGFADIFILSLIVLVYAAIIVNLILKLK